MPDHSKYLHKDVKAFTTKANTRVLSLENIVQISEAHDLNSVDPQPTTNSYIAIWDTGATGTVITSKVVTELGLQPIGQVMVQGVGQAGTQQAHLSKKFIINLYLPNQVAFVGVPVTENSLGGCDVLIGMDVIKEGDLAITNHEGRTTWTFRTPPCEEIDFVNEINTYNSYMASLSRTQNKDTQRKNRNRRKAKKRQGRKKRKR